ncbi:heterokaryon incompatibility protein-domain-containing protein [Cercophora scortea]|uniref:Heterokaryon incompatibility protein-domain-containing protein n=1 Tax=Cercophora scortea TaxID=314031 RepID=A0AAE0I6G0_9PEZI|nr:heterokaryon incompatibility protein-domain-containing protein [Cercophora scortea]
MDPYYLTNSPARPLLSIVTYAFGAVIDYQYEALRGNEIRLITLRPGNFDDNILVRLSHVPLLPSRDYSSERMRLEQVAETLPSDWRVFEVPDGPDFEYKRTSWVHSHESVSKFSYEKPGRGRVHRNHDYEALSYTWGSEADKETISVESSSSLSASSMPSTDTALRTRRLDITRNLASALRHLRYPDRERTLWIDAISINQGDDSEREQQVWRMTDIYRSAYRVVIWLGAGGQNSSLALSTLEHLAHEIVRDVKSGHAFKSPDAKESEWSPTDDFLLPYSKETWRAINDLVHRDWFGRLWIVQEAKLAEAAILCCGHDQIPWSDFHQALETIGRSKNLPDEIERSLPISVKLWDMGRKRECKDPRDKIYGVLGLLPALFRAKISPQYGDTPVRTTYQEATLAHIRHVQRLELLSQSYLHRRRIDGPSWVPDFSAPYPVHNRVLHRFAAGFSRSWVRFDDSNRDFLLVEGVQCAVVTALSPPVPETMDKKAVLRAVRALEPNEVVMASTYPTGGPFSIAYAKTLSGNFLDERRPGCGWPTLESWSCQNSNNALFGPFSRGARSDSDDDTLLSYFEERALNLVEGRPYMWTKEGYFSLAPVRTAEGDIICVFLGCHFPMVLRPQPNGRFAVVGESYVYGLNDGIGLLGALPGEWRVQIFQDSSSITEGCYRFYDPDTSTLTDEDPRLEPLEEWERMDHMRTGDDPFVFQYYMHKVTGETVNSDPRMTPEALRARGVDVRTFQLV